jgi:succinoglycan biosynthesis protein ExoV
MILYHWQGSASNFGDALNPLLWPRLLPNFFDDDPGASFLGIGSVLDRRHAGPGRKLVAGAGYGGYQKPVRLDASWTIHWVRGPRTAARLGLPAALGLGDPAALLPQAGLAPVRTGTAIGFMPHFESLESGAWPAVAAAAGLTLIDPRGDPAGVLAAIAGCRLLLSEAMHGVIVADTLRVPWIAIRPLARRHRPKWADWAGSLGLTVRFRRLGASSAAEWVGASGLAARQPGRALLGACQPGLAGLGAAWLCDRAAGALQRAAAAEPQLSADAALARSQTRMLEALRRLRLSPWTGAAHPGTAGPTRSDLQPRDLSAYHIHPTG